ncbi:MAG: MBL fold metallo-hydrolase [Candidatus Omnitrophica bacterium]|nr:MBL fold metallo-hydrolase [Candidatus Omnitrophota bacterium]
MLDKIHWLGHAGFFIDAPLSKIYIDPYKLKKTFSPADIILITHDHFDHFSPEDIKKISKPDTVIVGPHSLRGKLKHPTRLIKPGEKINLKVIDIEGFFSYNTDKNFHPKKNGYLGFVVNIENMRIYHAGDTDFIPEMKELKADIALVPVGGTYTMNAKEASAAVNLFNPQIAIPMHWGSIVGSRVDAEEFKKLCKCEVKIIGEE